MDIVVKVLFYKLKMNLDIRPSILYQVKSSCATCRYLMEIQIVPTNKEQNSSVNIILLKYEKLFVIFDVCVCVCRCR